MPMKLNTKEKKYPLIVIIPSAIVCPFLIIIMKLSRINVNVPYAVFVDFCSTLEILNPLRCFLDRSNRADKKICKHTDACFDVVHGAFKIR